MTLSEEGDIESHTTITYTNHEFMVWIYIKRTHFLKNSPGLNPGGGGSFGMATSGDAAPPPNAALVSLNIPIFGRCSQRSQITILVVPTPRPNTHPDALAI